MRGYEWQKSNNYDWQFDCFEYSNQIMFFWEMKKIFDKLSAVNIYLTIDLIRIWSKERTDRIIVKKPKSFQWLFIQIKINIEKKDFNKTINIWWVSIGFVIFNITNFSISILSISIEEIFYQKRNIASGSFCYLLWREIQAK